jgi:hypothetical protein
MQGLTVRETPVLDINGLSTGQTLPMGTRVILDIAIIGSFDENGKEVGEQLDLRLCKLPNQPEQFWLNEKDLNTNLI